MDRHRITHEEQNVYIRGERLKGVQSCAVSWSSPETYVNAIGYQGGTVGISVDDYMSVNFDVEQIITSSHDPIINLFESTEVSGEIEYGENNFAFNQGQITSYGCSCEVGSLPIINSSFLAYKNSGGGALANSRRPEDDENIIIALPGTLSLDVFGRATNSIQSIAITAEIGRQPVPIIGENIPTNFIIDFPLQVDCQFTLIVQDYESSNLYDFICTPREQDLLFKFLNCHNNEIIRQFFMPKARMVDYSQDAGLNDTLIASFTYKSLIKSLADLKKVFNGETFS